jgi:microcompartment protein CcmL/EutN/microcompartment protein CcmK/EutM
MLMGRVVGNVWATRKAESLTGMRMLLVRPFTTGREEAQDVIVAGDPLGAGMGETVLVAFGRAARTVLGSQDVGWQAADRRDRGQHQPRPTAAPSSSATRASASRYERRAMSAAVGGQGPCIGLLELASIAAGFETADALRKEAAVRLLGARPVTPGKFVILFTGPVEEVASALRRGLETGADSLIDSLFIPNVEPTLLALIEATRGRRPATGAAGAPIALDAGGIIETLSVASTIRAADIASKTADAAARGPRSWRPASGGKSYVTFTGEVGDDRSRARGRRGDAERAGMLVRKVLIARPHADMAEVFGA